MFSYTPCTAVENPACCPKTGRQAADDIVGRVSVYHPWVGNCGDAGSPNSCCEAHPAPALKAASRQLTVNSRRAIGCLCIPVPVIASQVWYLQAELNLSQAARRGVPGHPRLRARSAAAQHLLYGILVPQGPLELPTLTRIDRARKRLSIVCLPGWVVAVSQRRARPTLREGKRSAGFMQAGCLADSSP